MYLVDRDTAASTTAQVPFVNMNINIKHCPARKVWKKLISIWAVYVDLKRLKSQRQISDFLVFWIFGRSDCAIIIAIIMFARSYLLLASNSTFMTGSLYLRIIQVCPNMNEHYYHFIWTTSVIWQIDANCSPVQSLNMLPFQIRFRTLKTNLPRLISNFAKYYLKKIYLVFLLSHVLTDLEFDSNHFGALLW